MTQYQDIFGGSGNSCLKTCRSVIGWGSGFVQPEERGYIFGLVMTFCNRSCRTFCTSSLKVYGSHASASSYGNFDCTAGISNWRTLGDIEGASMFLQVLLNSMLKF